MNIDRSIQQNRIEIAYMMNYLITIAPLFALIISIAALWIGIYNLRSQLRACFHAEWTSPHGAQRYLVITNAGPGIAKVMNVKLQTKPKEPAIDFTYAKDRVIFPFELGSGARFEIQLDGNQAHPNNIRVDWKDGRFRTQSQRIPVSSSRSAAR